jgi:GntR family transcriptional regulator, transcriptional repressor for pyruvate dehydrogenase complex
LGAYVYKAVRTARLYEQIVEQIEDSIHKGLLKPGDQLPPERELAQQFGVSRTAVREAVRALHEKQLVEAYSGKGTFVTNGRSNAIRRSLGSLVKDGRTKGAAYLLEVREILEPEIAALAATRIEQQGVATLQEAVGVMDRSYDDPDAFVEADLDFHLALAEAAGNPVILSLLDSIVDMLREQRTKICMLRGGPERGQTHHKNILRAVKARDPNKTKEAMRAHMKQVRDDLQLGSTKR